jgi:hypothetical protein
VSFPFYSQNTETYARDKAQAAASVLPQIATASPPLLYYTASDGQSLSSVLQALFPGVRITDTILNYAIANYPVSNPYDLFQGELVAMPANLVELAASDT